MIKYYIAASTKAEPITDIHPKATTQASGRLRVSRTKPILPEGAKFIPLTNLWDEASEARKDEGYIEDHTSLVTSVDEYLAIIDAGDETGDIAIVYKPQAEYLIANHIEFKPIESESE